jgi:cytochrome c553
MKNFLFLGVFALVMTLIQCTKESAVDIATCTGTTPTYTADIKAIMNASCATSGCHNATTKESGYDLSSYAGTKAAAAKTAFLGSMQHKSGYDVMPRGASKLSDATLTKIACWVQNGTPE